MDTYHSSGILYNYSFAHLIMIKIINSLYNIFSNIANFLELPIKMKQYLSLFKGELLFLLISYVQCCIYCCLARNKYTFVKGLFHLETQRKSYLYLNQESKQMSQEALAMYYTIFCQLIQGRGTVWQ